MTLALFIAALLTALAVCAVMLQKPYGYLTYPLLVAGFYLAWLAPQLAVVMQDPFAPQDGLWAMSLMVFLALPGVVFAWAAGCRQAAGRLASPGARPNIPPASDLFWPVAALTVVSIGCRTLLGTMRLDPTLTTQWSGPIVIVYTVAAIRIIPLFLSLSLVLRRRTPATVALATVNLLLCASFAFVDIGRSETIDFVLVLFLSLWFARRIRVPLPILACSGAALAVFVFAVGELRHASSDYFDLTGRRVSIFSPAVWRNIDFEQASANAAEKAPDVRNAVYLMAHRQWAGGYTFGTRFWDNLVFRWVPAQLVGQNLKSALMFEYDVDAVYDVIADRYNYERAVGTTSTGFGVAFSEFWYFGALLFSVYAWFAGRWWTLGQRGDVWAQVMYAATLGSGLINFTHDAYWTWMSLPLFLAGVGFVKVWLWAVARPGAADPGAPQARLV